jgi:1-acyl-sn-glycerol-3-phosphate acyltransferase
VEAVSHERRALTVQSRVGWALAPLWMPMCAALMRGALGWRIYGAEEARAVYRRLRRDRLGPLLVCANHLTMLDSLLVTWALGTPGFYLRDWGALPWNTPERANFARSWWQRAAIYAAKCIPISRGGDRAEVAGVLGRVRAVLARGDAALVFPESGRSRTGRVQAESAAWGVGRVVRSLPGCRVLCVYLRGERQETWSDFPARNQRFHVQVECFEPKSDLRGVRGSMDVVHQIVAALADLEKRHFDARR